MQKHRSTLSPPRTVRGVLGLFAVAAIAGSCSDEPTAVDRSSETPASAVVALKPDKKKLPFKDLTFFCTTSQPNGSGKYKYGLIRVRFTRAEIERANGEWTEFKHVAPGHNESTPWVARCNVPATAEGYNRALQRLGSRVRIRLNDSRSNRSAVPIQTADGDLMVLAATSDQEEQEDCDRWEVNPNDPWEYYCVAELPPVTNEPPPPPPVWVIEPPPPDEPLPPPPEGDGSGPNPPTPPEPTEDGELQLNVSCPAEVQRGDEADCTTTLSPGAAMITKWQFVSADGADVIPGLEPDQSWKGVVVKSGTVTVWGSYGGAVQARSASMTVTDRTLDWKWELGDGDGYACSLDVPLEEAFHAYGWTVSNSTCTGDIVVPDAEAGANLTAGTGPNAGIWFVRPTYTIDAHTQILSEFKPNAPGRPLTAAQRQMCIDKGVSASDAGMMNMYHFNTKCTRDSFFTEFYVDLWRHEWAHKYHGETEAKKAVNQLNQLVEAMVGTESSDVLTRVRNIYVDVDRRVFNAAYYNVHNSNNPTVEYYVYKWMRATGTYQRLPIELKYWVKP